MPRELDLLTILATRKPESWVLTDTLHLVDNYQIMNRVHAACAEPYARRCIVTPRFWHKPWWLPFFADPCIHCNNMRYGGVPMQPELWARRVYAKLAGRKLKGVP